jgi:nicotinamide mononucleotide transporter
MFSLETLEWQQLLGTTPLAIIATVCSVAGVILIARQNILGWPLGLVWAAISAWLAFFEWNLLSDCITYLSAIPIQIYCWVVWARRGAVGGEGRGPFLPTWLDRRQQVPLVVAAAVSILLWGLGISAAAGIVEGIPAPSLLWRDSTTTVLGFYAQFLQARKRMENWVGWIIVNLLGIHIYWVKDAPIYSLQYAFFLVLGIYGWIQWQKHAEAGLHNR